MHRDRENERKLLFLPSVIRLSKYEPVGVFLHLFAPKPSDIKLQDSWTQTQRTILL